MKTAPVPPPSQSIAGQSLAGSPAAISCAPSTPALTSDPDLAALIRIVVKLHNGPIALGDLLPALLVQFPSKDPAEVHDTLNNLLAAGFLKLSPIGEYYV